MGGNYNEATDLLRFPEIHLISRQVSIYMEIFSMKRYYFKIFYYCVSKFWFKIITLQQNSLNSAAIINKSKDENHFV